MNNIWGLIGPSGTGKSSLEIALVSAYPWLQRGISVTTRAPRTGELDGIHYFFVSEAEFDRLVATGEMAEYVQFASHRSGLTRKEIDSKLAVGPLLLVVDDNGIRQFQAAYPDSVKTIYLKPPSPLDLQLRRQRRGDSPADLADPARAAADRRIEQFEAEADYVVVTDTLENALRKASWLMRLANRAA